MEVGARALAGLHTACTPWASEKGPCWGGECTWLSTESSQEGIRIYLAAAEYSSVISESCCSKSKVHKGDSIGRFFV